MHDAKNKRGGSDNKKKQTTWYLPVYIERELIII